MKIYDKVAWHIDAGEDSRVVLEKIKIVFSFLKANHMLSEEGLELFDLGIDSSASLHERLLTAEGNAFIGKNYDSVMDLKADEILAKLNSFI